MKNKNKVTIELLVNVIELFDSEDEGNKAIAYCLLNQFDWNTSSKRHLFYCELFWYAYTGYFITNKDDICYSFERNFSNKVLKKFKGFRNLSSRSKDPDCEGLIYLTNNMQIKVKRFLRRYLNYDKRKFYSIINIF
jgi:hypothetical protein